MTLLHRLSEIKDQTRNRFGMPTQPGKAGSLTKGNKIMNVTSPNHLNGNPDRPYSNRETSTLSVADLLLHSLRFVGAKQTMNRCLSLALFLCACIALALPSRAQISVTVANPNLVIPAPISGSVTYDIQGTLTIARGYTLAGPTIYSAFDATGASISTINAPRVNLAAANNGHTYMGILLQVTVNANTLPGVYALDYYGNSLHAEFDAIPLGGGLASHVEAYYTITVTNPYQIDAGGPAAYPFSADMFFNAGYVNNTSHAISTIGVLDPAPQAVYQTERYGNGAFSYTIPGLVPNTTYTVRLHFAEIYYTQIGQRLFNVISPEANINPALNGLVLSNFDVFASAGGGKNVGEYQAVVEQFDAKANNQGVVTINFTNVVGGAKVSGLEVLPQDYYLRTGWTATASSNYPTDPPGLALDGTTGTRWTSGLPQAFNQWFEVDMGSVHTFSKIVLDNSNSPFDFPRGYLVYISNDGIHWGTSVAMGNKSNLTYCDNTVIAFQSTQSARYIRIVQTGSNPTYWWSIGEFYVYP